MSLLKKALAECLGTCVLTLVACGIAVMCHNDIVMASLGFGLVIVALAYSIGNVSGCHINPAVSLAMAIRKEITWKEFAAFTRQFANLGGNEIALALANHDSWELDAWSYILAFLVEVVLTFVFVFAIIGVTDGKFGNGKLGGLVIGLALVLVHLFGIQLTGTSVNPARGLSAAICQVGEDATSAQQSWIWVLAPFAGGALAAVVYTLFFGKKETKADGTDESSKLETTEE